MKYVLGIKFSPMSPKVMRKSYIAICKRYRSIGGGCAQNSANNSSDMAAAAKLPHPQ